MVHNSFEKILIKNETKIEKTHTILTLLMEIVTYTSDKTVLRLDLVVFKFINKWRSKSIGCKVSKHFDNNYKYNCMVETRKTEIT